MKNPTHQIMSDGTIGLIPLPHFIKLPDGTIINVANVGMVASWTEIFGAATIQYTAIQVINEECRREDTDGKIYDYFERIAQDIRIANLPVNVELCWKCDKERSNDQDEDCPHCGEMWAPF